MLYYQNKIYFWLYKKSLDVEFENLRIKAKGLLNYKESQILCFFISGVKEDVEKKLNCSRERYSLEKLPSVNVVHIYGNCSKKDWSRVSCILNFVFLQNKLKIVRYICVNSNGVSPYMVNSIDERIVLHFSKSIGRKTMYEFTVTKFSETRGRSISHSPKSNRGEFQEGFVALSNFEVLKFIEGFYTAPSFDGEE